MSTENLKKCKELATTLSQEEISDLWGFLKSCYNQQKTTKSLIAKAHLAEHDKVIFDARGGLKATGEIIKIKRTTALVMCESGLVGMYNVPLGSLEKVEN